MSPDTQVGPIANKPQFEKILNYIDIAKGEGAHAVLGGSARSRPECGDGWFVEPTIFTGVNNRMRIAQEEVFGPVLAVIPFKDEEEAIAIGNDVGLRPRGRRLDAEHPARADDGGAAAGRHGLGQHLPRQSATCRRSAATSDRGFGRESGQEMIKEYLQTKSVWISTATEVPNPFIQR